MEWNEARLLLLTSGDGSPSARALARGVAGGTHLRLRRSVHVEGAVWSRLTTEERLQLRMLALHITSRSRPVFSHWSAALLHGLPIPRHAADLVDLTVDAGRNRQVVGARVHQQSMDPGEVVEIDGMLCTSIPRTTVDVAAGGGFEEAVVLADAALAALGPGADALLGAAEDLQAGRRGSQKVRKVLDFADARSGSAGESMSRVRIDRFGFVRPRLQVAVVTSGFRDVVDFEWDEAFGEFDGEVRYRNARMRGGRSVEDVVIDEKNRENRLRRRRRGFARWDWSELLVGRLEAILRDASVPKRDEDDRDAAA